MSDYLLETKRQKKQGNKWITIEHDVKLATQTQLHNTICKETLRFFRRLGGKESVRYTDRYIKNISISPDRTLRTIRIFWYQLDKKIKLEVTND